MFTFAIASAGVVSSVAAQDRAEVIPLPDGIVIVVADGAGGVSGGAFAAQGVVKAVRDSVAAGVTPRDAEDWASFLRHLDGELFMDRDAGETTAVVLRVSSDGISGASVGDSGAWLVTADSDELTAAQQRKPLLGTGNATPVGFWREALEGTLVVASDGLWKYARQTGWVQAARGPDLDVAARQMIDLARLPTGGLQDDTVVVLIRSDGLPSRA